MPSRTIRPTQAPASAPFAYTVAAPEGFAPEAVFASWDGSGAGGDFLPCVSYYNADGVLLDRAFPEGVVLHAGDTAEVGYRPFRRGGGAGGGTASGIVFDTPNVGGSLEITTTLAGFVFVATTGGIDLTAADVSNVNLISLGGDAKVHAAGTATLESDLDTNVSAKDGDLTVRSRNGVTTVRGDTLILRSDNVLFMDNLPIIDPGMSGALWNNGGFVAVSP